MLLPPLGRDLAGPLRPAAALVLALPVLSVCAHDAVPLGAGWLVLALRELLAGALLAGVLAAPWAVLAGVARVTEALGPWPTAEGADGPLTRLVVGVGTLSLLGLGAHRGVVRAVAASQAVFPSGGDPAAPWALDAAMAAHGVLVEASDDPGRFVCNALYYAALSAGRPWSAYSVFVHVPPRERDVGVALQEAVRRTVEVYRAALARALTGGDRGR